MHLLPSFPFNINQTVLLIDLSKNHITNLLEFFFLFHIPVVLQSLPHI